jgi:hypothetical protein
MPIISNFKDVVFVDQKKLWEEINSEGCLDGKLARLFSACSVPSYDTENLYVKNPIVMVKSIGGLPITNNDSISPLVSNMPIEDFINQAYDTMGFAAMDSYLNPKGRNPKEMLDLNVGLHGVPSVAHTVHIGLYIVGLSNKAELEFSCQRDIVHLSRLTSARTKAQDNPPFLVEDPGMLDYYKNLREFINTNNPKVCHNQRDREIRNSSWPLSKCTTLGVTGSLKDLFKLSELSNDEGKEAEVRVICGEIKNILENLFPAVFSTSPNY